MLVDEYSTSVDTVKKEPPFAKIEAGNANRTTSKRRFIHMDEKSLSHTCWNCKYHIVLVPKYRRKVIYGKLRKDIGRILRMLCDYKHVEIIEAHAMPDHIHMLVSIPPKLAVADFMGYLKGKSTLMIFERHANMKYKYGRRVFWAKGYYAALLILYNKLSSYNPISENRISKNIAIVFLALAVVLIITKGLLES